MTKTLIAALLAALLLLGACGGGSESSPSSSSSSSSSSPSSSSSDSSSPAPSGQDAKAAAAISGFFLNEQKPGSGAGQLLSTDRDDADCIGKGAVDRIGVDRLKKTGVLEDDLTVAMRTTTMTADEATTMTDVMTGCTDIGEMMKKVVNNDRSDPLPKDVRVCLDRALTETSLRPVFVALFQGKDAAAQQALGGPLAGCARLAGRQ
jgi:hypothetical protein